MTIVSGNASRFRGQSNPSIGNSGKAKVVDDKAIRNPPPPLAYEGLQVGPGLTVEYEPNVTIPVDGANQLLRSLSPFIFRIEPPFVFANDPAFTDQTNDKGIGTFSNALRSSQGFGSARGAIGRQFAFGSLGAPATSVEQFVSKSGDAQAKGGDDPDGLFLVDGTPPDSLGKPAITDMFTAVDIAMQLQAALNTPPLVLLINPQSLSMSFTKLQQFQDRTRFGYVFQAWGEEQPTLSISARCGAFYSGGRGVQLASRRDSASWQNLMNALTFYRNNGYIYDTVGKSNANHFVGVISIHYDGWIYYGNMESFSYTYEEANQLGGVVFEMEFKVSTMVDASQSNLVVTPMRAPTRSLSDFRLAQRQDLNREGALSVGLGGTVDDRLFGSTKPQAWSTDQTTGGKGSGVSQGTPLPPARGRSGFTAVPATEVAAPPTLASRPEPFGR